jgi:hypothetical protein
MDQFPPIEDIRASLAGLSHQQLHYLSRGSSVPYTTLLKIRSGITGNPGIETVRKFWPLVPAIQTGWDGTERRGKQRATKAGA